MIPRHSPSTQHCKKGTGKWLYYYYFLNVIILNEPEVVFLESWSCQYYILSLEETRWKNFSMVGCSSYCDTVGSDQLKPPKYPVSREQKNHWWYNISSVWFQMLIWAMNDSSICLSDSELLKNVDIFKQHKKKSLKWTLRVYSELIHPLCPHVIRMLLLHSVCSSRSLVLDSLFQNLLKQAISLA